MSDQDFFFDEDEKPAEKSTSKSTDKPASRKSGSSSGSTAATSASIGEQTVTMTVAALIGVVTLLLGVIIGLFVAPDSSKVAAPSVSPTGQTGTAPQLSDDQIQQGLPPGHVPIPDGVAPESTTTTPTE